ncbi:hypothetical protein [Methylomonas koyamae]|uniref:hypothetical protein n=1 Tax=Methylomonas koyamae TaxID=702114 RepID=UPI000ABA245C|nr:hypothetical protein [Methylomonas koyamae]
MAELQRLNRLQSGNPSGYWGRFAVIARNWQNLEMLEALCRRSGIPVRSLRDEYLLDLHSTREGRVLIRLLSSRQRQGRKPRLLLRWGALSRWFRRCYRQAVTAEIAHPYRALLAQFIAEAESAAPGCQLVAANLLDALYEFGSGSQTAGQQINSPLTLLTAHRAKGLEFDHVLVLDGGAWQSAAPTSGACFTWR